jgi:hypothetical protein
MYYFLHEDECNDIKFTGMRTTFPKSCWSSSELVDCKVQDLDWYGNIDTNLQHFEWYSSHVNHRPTRNMKRTSILFDIDGNTIVKFKEIQ